MPPAPDGHTWAASGLDPTQWHDAQLLTAITVFLAACGVAHSVRATQAGGLSDGEASALSASPRAEASFRASVRRVLQREVAPLAPLGRADFARLCQLLDLPLHVGASWQARVLTLQAQLQPHGPSRPMFDGDDAGGDCAASAMSAFCAALASERRRELHGLPHEPERAKVRHFGRQTVWATVSLLRQILREANWPAGGRRLSADQAEAKLASLAVAAIGGGCPAIEKEAMAEAAPAVAAVACEEDVNSSSCAEL